MVVELVRRFCFYFAERASQGFGSFLFALLDGLPYIVHEISDVVEEMESVHHKTQHDLTQFHGHPAVAQADLDHDGAAEDVVVATTLRRHGGFINFQYVDHAALVAVVGQVGEFGIVEHRGEINVEGAAATRILVLVKINEVFLDVGGGQEMHDVQQQGVLLGGDVVHLAGHQRKVDALGQKGFPGFPGLILHGVLFTTMPRKKIHGQR